ncbi:MAG TPA: hypothetical protein VHA82_21120 [Ramlibacter sp.]|uniref:hypothetical protein n=1 Tax=Ramlibacter sp. TaxID=1917967 RepID=UPI002B6EFD07|nr:hypothetical protein [Ramlibacter sp.]HVZ46320.1 hypothetical protein [Ramlibacter sp.]
MPTHDLQGRRIACVGAIVMLVVVATVGVAMMLLGHWQVLPGEDRVRLPLPVSADAPRLASAPRIERERYEAEKLRASQASGWIDPAQGIASVPIATAMAMLARPTASAASGASR